tara:strand:+ start:3023 stop:3604 length:582 start_codon:yes stop_codon:yes gene_type:complete
MKLKLICIINFVTILFSSGGYDDGSSAGKGKFDLSFTLNPFNYFEYGQSYLIVGYGLTDKFDLHGYFSSGQDKQQNYYGGIFYQFFKNNRFHLATAVGIRKFRQSQITHIFFPQFLYNIKISEYWSIGGSVVNIREMKLESEIGTSFDIFIKKNLYESNKYKLDITFGGFKPVMWEPKTGDFYPTYSIDIKIK